MSYEPVPIRDSMDGVVRALRGGGHDARSMGSLFSRWVDAVGQTVADHARPVKLDGDRLLVEVDEPGWATQLRFLEGLGSRLDRLVRNTVGHLGSPLP